MKEEREDKENARTVQKQDLSLRVSVVPSAGELRHTVWSSPTGRLAGGRTGWSSGGVAEPEGREVLSKELLQRGTTRVDPGVMQTGRGAAEAAAERVWQQLFGGPSVEGGRGCRAKGWEGCAG